MSEKFKYFGDAYVLHINPRKEGNEDKELAVDVKLQVIMSVYDVEMFDDELPKLLFKSDRSLRNKMLGPITFLHEMKGYRIAILGHVSHDVKLKKFSIAPVEKIVPGNSCDVFVTFQASFKPTGNEVACLAEYLQEGTLHLEIEPSDGEFEFGVAA